VQSHFASFWQKKREGVAHLWLSWASQNGGPQHRQRRSQDGRFNSAGHRTPNCASSCALSQCAEALRLPPAVGLAAAARRTIAYRAHLRLDRWLDRWLDIVHDQFASAPVPHLRILDIVDE